MFEELIVSAAFRELENLKLRIEEELEQRRMANRTAEEAATDRANQNAAFFAELEAKKQGYCPRCGRGT